MMLMFDSVKITLIFRFFFLCTDAFYETFYCFRYIKAVNTKQEISDTAVKPTLQLFLNHINL